jgi:hypothetical protein
MPNPGRPAKGVGSANPTLAQLGPGFVPCRPLVSYCLWLPLGFGHNEEMYGFWSIWCFSVIQCSWNGKSTKLVELISNKHLSSISWMKCRYVGSKYMHFMTTNKAHPRISSVALLADLRMRDHRSPVEINLGVNLRNEWWTVSNSGLIKHYPVTTTNNHRAADKSVWLIILVRIIPCNL